MDFQTFHRYNRLARRGVTKPLTCQHCNSELGLFNSEKDEPALRCYVCNTVVLPGTKMYDRLKAVVSEYYVEN